MRQYVLEKRLKQLCAFSVGGTCMTGPMSGGIWTGREQWCGSWCLNDTMLVMVGGVRMETGG